MNVQHQWHDQDQFWEVFSPFMFPEDRLAATAGEINMMLDLVQPSKGAHFLDLACGPGRHSLELARRGYRVTGIDRTKLFIEKAKRNSEAEELAIEYLLADMRQFVRPATYDVVISMFTSFGYFEEQKENQQVLGNLYTSLKAGGSLLIELMGKEILARVFRERDWQEINGLFHLQERKIARDWSWLENRWILLTGKEEYEFQVNHWVYSGAELAAMLREAGFSKIHLFGGIDGSPYDDDAQRLVALASKQ